MLLIKIELRVGGETNCKREVKSLNILLERHRNSFVLASWRLYKVRCSSTMSIR